MSLLRCQVEYEKDQSVFQPGDVLTGRVVLTLDERQLLKAFALKISGFANVRWEKILPTKKQKNNEKANKKKKQKKDPYAEVYCEQEQVQQLEQKVQVYSNREDFISTTNYFIGSEEAFPKIIERGVYFYPFRVTLPQQCPSSFESETGHIRYQLEVFADFVDRCETVYARELLLRKAYDLRQYAATLDGCDVVVDEKNSPLKFWQHPLQLYVNVQRLGYIPGEYISVHVTLENPDRLKLHELAYQLNAVGTYTAAHGKKKPKTKLVRNCLLRSVHGFCGLNAEKTQHLQALHVPETSPSTLPGDCRCLQIAYEVEVVLTTAQQKRTLTAQVPITIGTVSLEQLRGSGATEGSNEDCDIVPAIVNGGGGSGDAAGKLNGRPALLAARSMDDLSVRRVSDAFATATAPETAQSVLANSDLANAVFMPSTALSKNVTHAKSCDGLDYTPMYPFYEMNEAATATAALQQSALNAAPAVKRTAPAAPVAQAAPVTTQNNIKEQIILELENLQRTGVRPAPTAPPTDTTSTSEGTTGIATALASSSLSVTTSAPEPATPAPPSYDEAQQQQLIREMEAVLSRTNKNT